MTKAPIYIVLGEAEFRDLVAGRVAKTATASGGQLQPVEIILSDIGWERMTRAIAVAMGRGKDE